MTNGKGSKPRPITNRAKYDAEYDRIFKKFCEVCGAKVKRCMCKKRVDSKKGKR